MGKSSTGGSFLSNLGSALQERYPVAGALGDAAFGGDQQSPAGEIQPGSALQGNGSSFLSNFQPDQIVQNGQNLQNSYSQFYQPPELKQGGLKSLIVKMLTGGMG